MKKRIKRIGNSLAFIFSREEIGIYGIKEGKVFDIEIAPAAQVRK